MTTPPPPPLSTPPQARLQPVYAVQKTSMPAGRVALLVITLLALLVTAGVVFFRSVMSNLRDSEATKTAVRLAGADPRVVAETGSPLQVTRLLSGSINTSNTGGNAHLRIAVKGPLASGTVLADEYKEGNVWTPTLLIFQQDGQPAGSSVVIVNQN